MASKRPMVDPGFGPCEDGGIPIPDGDYIACMYLPISGAQDNLLQCKDGKLYVECCLPDPRGKDEGFQLVIGEDGPEWADPKEAANVDVFDTPIES